MTAPRPRFWYCFHCNVKIPERHGKPHPRWHVLSDCDVLEAIVMRVSKKKDDERGRAA